MGKLQARILYFVRLTKKQELETGQLFINGQPISSPHILVLDIIASWYHGTYAIISPIIMFPCLQVCSFL